MSQKIVLTSNRDIPIILFLWKWKIATTKAIHHRFFENLDLKTAYHRLYILKRGGFIQVRTSLSGQNPVWCLTIKGFGVAKEYLPALKEDGFKAEHIRHDLICQAVHLGEFLNGQPESIALLTEQELRRIEPEYLPHWLPMCDGHRADGYWHIENGKDNQVVALEVELHYKTTDRFEETINYYADNKKIDKIIWVIAGPSLLRKVHSTIRKIEPEDLSRHYFLELRHFLENHWSAKITSGLNSSMTMRNLFFKPGTKQAQKWHKPICAKFMLDYRISGYKDKKILHPQKV